MTLARADADFYNTLAAYESSSLHALLLLFFHLGDPITQRFWLPRAFFPRNFRPRSKMSLKHHGGDVNASVAHGQAIGTKLSFSFLVVVYGRRDATLERFAVPTDSTRGVSSMFARSQSVRFLVRGHRHKARGRQNQKCDRSRLPPPPSSLHPPGLPM